MPVISDTLEVWVGLTVDQEVGIRLFWGLGIVENVGAVDIVFGHLTHHIADKCRHGWIRRWAMNTLAGSDCFWDDLELFDVGFKGANGCFQLDGGEFAGILYKLYKAEDIGDKEDEQDDLTDEQGHRPA